MSLKRCAFRRKQLRLVLTEEDLRNALIETVEVVAVDDDG